MSTEASVSESIPHPRGDNFRPLELTTERTEATRSAWFTGIEKRSLFPWSPELSLFGWLVIGSLLLVVVAVTYGIALIAFFFYRRWVQQQNGPVPALRPELMAEEREAAIKRARNQAMLDCGVNETEWQDAVESGRVVAVAESSDVVLAGEQGIPLAAEVRIVTAGAMDGGMVQHETTWLASRGSDPAGNAFVRSEDQQIPWRAVSRVRRADGRLTIETVGGSATSVSLVAAESRESETAVNLNREDYITAYVPTFVEAAQKKVMAV